MHQFSPYSHYQQDDLFLRESYELQIPQCWELQKKTPNDCTKLKVDRPDYQAHYLQKSVLQTSPYSQPTAEKNIHYKMLKKKHFNKCNICASGCSLLLEWVPLINTVFRNFLEPFVELIPFFLGIFTTENKGVTRIQVQVIHKYFGNKLKITKQCQKLIVKEIHRPRPLYTEQDPTNVINLGDQKKKDFKSLLLHQHRKKR